MGWDDEMRRNDTNPQPPMIPMTFSIDKSHHGNSNSNNSDHNNNHNHVSMIHLMVESPDVQIAFYNATDMVSRNLMDWAFSLIKTNMKSIYQSSGFKWSTRAKRKEMNDCNSLYLVAFNTAKAKEKTPIAFVHYQLVNEEEETGACIYCYELQVERESQGLGMGKSFMKILEQLCLHYKKPKIMLTVQKANTFAMNFYLKLG